MLAATAIAGCGGGDEKKGSSSTVERVYRTPTAGQTTPEDVPVTPAPSKPSTSTTPAAKPPPRATDTVPGGSEPARTELTFTGTSAGIKPREAGVAPYVSVQVTLTSKDGSSHTLTIGGKTLRVGGTRKSAFVTLPGLRPGAGYAGRADGGATVRIRSTSEPGP
ncbi:MAG: hypothetical protein QOH76_1993 [Thermoleophilaceae bacterium]|nr:hypothetical protein [Thermoleophilaceae bacterium]